MVSGLQANNYEDRLKELGLESLEARRKRLDLTQTFKIVNGIDKVDKSTWFTHYNHDDRTTRLAANPLNLKHTERPRTEIRSNFFSQRVLNSWNELPDDVKNAPNLIAFKMKYSNFVDAQAL